LCQHAIKQRISWKKDVKYKNERLFRKYALRDLSKSLTLHMICMFSCRFSQNLGKE
jgi:hypothetical protein